MSDHLLHPPELVTAPPSSKPTPEEVSTTTPVEPTYLAAETTPWIFPPVSTMSTNIP